MWYNNLYMQIHLNLQQLKTYYITRHMKIFEQIKNTFRLSLYSPLYVLLCGVITYFTWAIGNSLLGMALLMLIACIVLIISEDILPVLPCLMYILMTTSDNNILNEDKTWPVMIVLAILLIGAFISHLISYPIKFKQHKLTYPLIAVSVALLTGGVGYLSSTQYIKGGIFILTLGPCLLLLYYLIRVYTRPPKEVNYKKYICYIMLVLGLLMVAQMFTHFHRVDKPLWEILRTDVINVGWGNRNGLSSLIAISAPCCFYLGFSSKRYAWLFYSIGLLLYSMVFITFCRGAILSVIITFPIFLIYSFAKGANRSQLLISICSVAIVISIFALIFKEEVALAIDRVLNMTLTSSGRNELFDEALICFLANPMFGVGMGYTGNNFNVPDFCIYWYHSTPLQIIASMGVIGIIAYVYFYFVRGKIMFSNLKRFNIALSIGIIAFELQSFVDNLTFTPFPYMLIIIVLTAMLEHNNSVENKTFMQSIIV